MNFAVASCLWNSPATWAGSALAKCFGTKDSGVWGGVTPLDSEMQWIGGQATAGAVCCASTTTECPMTDKWLLNQAVKCKPADGSASTGETLSCRQCAADATKAECNFFGPKFIPTAQDTCKFVDAPVTVVAQCPTPGFVKEPLGLVGAGTGPSVCAGFRCPGGSAPQPSCAALTPAAFSAAADWIAPCTNSICSTQADQRCGIPWSTSSCPSGAQL